MGKAPLTVNLPLPWPVQKSIGSRSDMMEIFIIIPFHPMQSTALRAARSGFVITPNTPVSEVCAEFLMTAVLYVVAQRVAMIGPIITQIIQIMQTVLSCAAGIIGNREPQTHQGCGASSTTRTSTS